jgi:asparagine synthetase B (glutamine-hydrolysing)
MRDTRVLPAAQVTVTPAQVPRGGHNSGSSSCGSGQLQLVLDASLLQLRGSARSTSPLVDAQGNVLCFNGEVFAGLAIPPGDNDGKALLAALAAAAAATAEGAADCATRGSNSPVHNQGQQQQQQQQPDAAPASIPALLSQLRGPWSLLYWHEAQQRLWFGRDVMGACACACHRHAWLCAVARVWLLIRLLQSGDFVLCHSLLCCPP